MGKKKYFLSVLILAKTVIIVSIVAFIYSKNFIYAVPNSNVSSITRSVVKNQKYKKNQIFINRHTKGINQRVNTMSTAYLSIIRAV
jgi:uncharacterized membrane-anchored protein YitT (DUF2179 family)